MAKKPAEGATEAPALVKVRLNCSYSGFPGDPGPGDVIAVDAGEAERLIGLGAASRIEE